MTTRKESLRNIGRKTEDYMKYENSIAGDYMPHIKSEGTFLILWV
jgi:hypothetical protein